MCCPSGSSKVKFDVEEIFRKILPISDYGQFVRFEMNSTVNRPLQLQRQGSRQQQHQQQQQQKQIPAPPAPLKRGASYHQQNALTVPQRGGGHYRKTSAEIVSEAKTMLAGGNGGGARLVSTRRPITPREPRRQLYGKLAPPGRPPSAFSLRYLQFESRALPSLEPIQQQQQRPQQIALEEIPTVPRSGSVGTLLDYVGATTNNNSAASSNQSIGTTTAATTNNNVRLQGKLPALLSPPKITASLDNLSEEMPPHHPDLQDSIDNNLSHEDQPQQEQQQNQHQLEDNVTSDKIDINQNIENESQPSAAIKDTSTAATTSSSHTSSSRAGNLLRTRQTKSFDVALSSASGDGNVPATIPLKDKIPNKVDLVGNHRRKDSPVRIGGAVGVGGVSAPFVTRTRLTRSNDLLAQSTTETLLDLLKAHAGIKECNEETVQHINAILVELYTRVKGAKGNWRGAILGGLYGLVECSSPKILLAVARVVLALCVTGSNLTGACKLVFKVARSETNDHLFADSDVPELLIEGLGRASPIDEPEACIYGYGAVRFLASAIQQQPNPTANVNGKSPITQVTNKQKSIAHRLARHGAVQLMVLHLQILNEVGAVQKLSGPPLHALFQLSAALRALAGIPQVIVNSVNLSKSLVTSVSLPEGNFPIIKETKEKQDINLELACPHLVKAAEICLGEPEVQANIVRTLSVMSEHDSCCEALSMYAARIGMLLGPSNNIPNCGVEKSLALLSRLGYILGNIMAKFDSARVQFYANDVAMEYLLDSLNTYSKQKLTISNQMGDTVLDVLVKLVRVVANISVNAEVGHSLGSRPILGDVLHHLLIVTNEEKDDNMTPEMEELLQATLGALHNLCFYQEDGNENREDVSDGSMCDCLSALSIALCETLNSGPQSVRAEVARVLGNMTRNELARESFCSAGGLKAIVKCLGSDDYELAATSSGVLVNLLGDWERRAPFRELKGPVLLRDILQKAAVQEDWLLAGIVCQAFWNFLIDSGNVIGALGEDEADYIAGNLAEYLDEKRIFKEDPPDMLWEQFATVATDLLERIQASMSYGNTPCCSSDDENDIIGFNNVDTPEISEKWKGEFKRWLDN
ncbi:armadillo repeat-containing protein 2 isoform X2 [Hermetia illucens]|nr:armadillo repeat-containing protein 2 isoform X2 [Hermetia illucens]